MYFCVQYLPSAFMDMFCCKQNTSVKINRLPRQISNDKKSEFVGKKWSISLCLRSFYLHYPHATPIFAFIVEIQVEIIPFPSFPTIMFQFLVVITLKSSLRYELISERTAEVREKKTINWKIKCMYQCERTNLLTAIWSMPYLWRNVSLSLYFFLFLADEHRLIKIQRKIQFTYL